MDEPIERRQYPAEREFTKLLEAHIADSEKYKERTTRTLEELREDINKLTKSTATVIEAYDTAQQTLKVSISFGKFIKFVGGLVLLYYSIVSLLPHDK